jgi:hypothetical protein
LAAQAFAEACSSLGDLGRASLKVWAEFCLAFLTHFFVLFDLLFSCKIQEISKWPKVKNALRVIKKFLLWVNLEIKIKFSVAIFCNLKNLSVELSNYI